MQSLFCFSQTVALWDLRNLKLKLHSFESHKDEIFQVRSDLIYLLVQHIFVWMYITDLFPRTEEASLVLDN